MVKNTEWTILARRESGDGVVYVRHWKGSGQDMELIEQKKCYAYNGVPEMRANPYRDACLYLSENSDEMKEKLQKFEAENTPVPSTYSRKN